MEDTNTPKTDLSKKEWEAIMTDYKESGLSQQLFCKQRGIDFNAFKNSRSRIAYHKKQALINSPPLSSNKIFAEMKVTSAPSRPEKFKITHPNGIECLVPASLSETEMLAILRGLKLC